MNSNIDFLIVGAGLYGVTVGRILTDLGYQCLIVEKNNHIGGLCYDTVMNDGLYHMHQHGAHVFHTDNIIAQKFFTSYCQLNNYVHSEIIEDETGNIFSLPINLMTLRQVYGLNKREEILNKLEGEQFAASAIYGNRTDAEAIASIKFGKTIYEKLIKDFIEKKYLKECKDLPGSIIEHINLNLDYDFIYFGNEICGLPMDGYTSTLGRIIDGDCNDGENHRPIPCLLNIDIKDNIKNWISLPNRNIIYCGAIDELLEYKLGQLEWKSLEILSAPYECTGDNTQGIAVINYINKKSNITRAVEHSQFYKERITPEVCPFDSIISFEQSVNFDPQKNQRYYAINDEKNNKLFNEYLQLLGKEYPNVLCGGRLGKYKNLDMDETILEAILDARNINAFYKNIEKENNDRSTGE